MSSAVTGKGVPVKVTNRSIRLSVLRLVRMAVAFVVVAGSLGLATVTATAQDGGSSCPSDGADNYSDVVADSTHADNIACLRELGISEAGDTYRPGDEMTRSEMAAFMANAYQALTGEEAPIADHEFTDIADDANADDIARISPNGLAITTGTTDTTYSPKDPVIRGHMALFLTRLYKAVAGSDAPAGDTEFTDIGDSNPEEQAAIGQIFALEVTTGTTPTTYSPSNNVTREQMGSFVARMYRALDALPDPAEAPGAPTGVEVAISGEDGDVVDVSWTAPEDSGTSDVTGYVVQWKSGDDDYSEDNQSSAEDTSADLGALTKGDTYTFRVAAVSADGQSDWSDEASALISAAPGTPTGVAVAVSGDAGDALDVSWTAPEDSGSSDVTSYVVQSKSGDDDYSEDNQISAEDTSANFPDLTQGDTYTFRVAAVSDDGQSDWSDEVSGNPGTVPGSVVDFTVAAGAAPGSLVLSWAAPADDGGTPITGYVVQWATGRDAAAMAQINDGSATSYTITGLKTGVSYRVHIQAVNGAGAGAITAPAEATQTAVRPSITPSGSVRVVLPTAASDSVGFRAGKRFMTVTWLTPTLGRGQNFVALDAAFEIQRRCGTENWPSAAETDRILSQGPAAPAVAVQSLPADHALLGGTGDAGTLTNGEECTYRVRANTYLDLAGGTAGTQDPGETTLVGAWVQGSATPLGAPGTPANASVEVANGSLNVSWTPPMTADTPPEVNDGGSAITGYKISWESPAETPIGDVTVSASSTSNTITGLTNGWLYTVKIQAVNARGASAATEAAVGTPAAVPGAPSNVGVSQPAAPAPGAIDYRGDRLVVTWSAPGGNGTAAVTGYVVQRRNSATVVPQADATGWLAVSPIHGDTNTGTTYNDNSVAADSGTSYDYRVRALNGVGDGGPWSTSASGAPAGLPGGVVRDNIEIISGNGSLILTWNAALGNGSDVTHYNLRYARNIQGVERWSSTRRVNASALPTYTISGLANGVPYVVGITAVNPVGSSLETQTITNPAPTFAVAGPSSVTAVPSPMGNTTGTNIDVTWSAVANVSAYQVEYRAVTVSPATPWSPVVPTGTSIKGIGGVDYFDAAQARKVTIAGLDEGTTYVVRVRPVTQPLVGGAPQDTATVGTPGFSAPVEAASTPETAPTLVSFAQVDKTTTLRVVWTHPPDAQTTEGVTSYLVTWYPTSTAVLGNRGSATVAADAKSYDITGLTAIGQNFTVVVAPVNEIGVGASATDTEDLTPATT